MNDIVSRYRTLRRQIETSAEQAARPAGSVHLVAVSKNHPAERMRPLLTTGHRLFGENRVQEAAAKWPELREAFPDIELHLIGPLQTNKVREAVALFDAIETLDRPKLAEALARTFALTGRILPCCVQVNIGREPQKSGVLPEDADIFLRSCRQDFDLPVHGLMAIPPVGQPPGPFFAALRAIAERNGIDMLSMGMSDDFEQAIANGATHVRIGTVLFGKREM